MMEFYSKAVQVADPYQTFKAIDRCKSLKNGEKETLKKYLSENVRDGYARTILNDVKTGSDLSLMLRLAATDEVMLDSDMEIVRHFAAIKVRSWNRELAQ